MITKHYCFARKSALNILIKQYSLNHYNDQLEVKFILDLHLIKKAKQPQRNMVGKTCFDVIGNNKGIVN